MKTKLLRKAKNRIKIYKRGSLFKVHNRTRNSYSHDFKFEETALAYYRYSVIEEAKNIFGYIPKKILR